MQQPDQNKLISTALAQVSQSVPPAMVSNDSDSGESLPELVSDCSTSDSHSDDSDNEDKYTKKAAKKAKAKAKAKLTK